jgi:hypothetical protein
MPEQRNPYKGSPDRSWLRLTLVAANGATTQLQAITDTGNPCALVVGADVMRQFNLGIAPGMNTNFGPLDGGWLRVQIPDIGFDDVILAYSSDAILQVAKASHPDFDGLVGLPLLRMMEFAGDCDNFWIRMP